MLSAGREAIVQPAVRQKYTNQTKAKTQDCPFWIVGLLGMVFSKHGSIPAHSHFWVKFTHQLPSNVMQVANGQELRTPSEQSPSDGSKITRDD
jgi:hypothetical protein